jgi:hypothetical protein
MAFGHPYDTWPFQSLKPPGPSAVKRQSQSLVAWIRNSSQVSAGQPSDLASLTRSLFRQLNPFKGRQLTSQPSSSQLEGVAKQLARASSQNQRDNEPIGVAKNAKDVFWPRDLLPSVLPRANVYT